MAHSSVSQSRQNVAPLNEEFTSQLSPCGGHNHRSLPMLLCAFQGQGLTIVFENIQYLYLMPPCYDSNFLKVHGVSSHSPLLTSSLTFYIMLKDYKICRYSNQTIAKMKAIS